MTEKISIETFDHLVELAALALSEDEAAYLRRELNHQLDAVNELAAIPLDEDLPLTAHGISYTAATSPAMRKDEWLPGENPEAIIAQVPQTDAGFIIVPDIPHTDLDEPHAA
jgi:aspartyl/glutamyl-tRNA(Asn/Gln) amidotransferase C subunit